MAIRRRRGESSRGAPRRAAPRVRLDSADVPTLAPSLVRTALAVGLGLGLLLWPAAGGAKETDSFTNRYEALAFPAGEVDGVRVSDFTDEFNDSFRGVFAEVLADLNEEGRRSGDGCHGARPRRRLFHRLSNRLGGPLVFAANRLRPAITRHPNRLEPRLAESIYQDFAPWRSISLGLAGRFGHNLAVLFRFDLEQALVETGGAVARAADRRLAVLGPHAPATARLFRLRAIEPAVIEHRGETFYLLDDGEALVESRGRVRRLIPILVSSDKFSHFFNRSLGLFKRLGAGSPADLERVMARNLWLEESLFGSKSTGVAAFGDLVANFQGMRFWIHLLGRGLEGQPLEDPLASGPVEPLLECSASGRWVQTREVDIRDYLDPAWDEALNCSRMRSAVLLRQVLRRIEGLDRQDPLGRSYACPVARSVITETASSYGRLADQVINLEGHGVLRSRGR